MATSSLAGNPINAVCPGLTDTPLFFGAWRDASEAAAFPIMAPEEIADAVVEAIVGGETGRALVCRPGREAIPFRFSNVPGPRAEGEGSIRPPTAQMDQAAG